jgi:hypothetical protein
VFSRPRLRAQALSMLVLSRWRRKVFGVFMHVSCRCG